MTPGAFFYVIGPSGAGKDSVIAWARAASDPGRIAFAHRYITRPALADAENHIALTPAEFAARRRAGWFALDWESHGLSYGIGREIDSWRADGIAVVVNGSRIHLAEAAARYPEIRPVLITAPEAAPQPTTQRIAGSWRRRSASFRSSYPARHPNTDCRSRPTNT